jgi:hypothetical protein
VKLPERIKDKLTTVLVGGIAGLFATSIYNDVAGPFLAYVLPAFSNKTLLSACSLLGLLVILLVCWVIYLHRRADKKFHAQFVETMEPLGFWHHKTKSGFFCPNCKLKHIESQLVDKGKLWRCPNHDCNHQVTKLEYPEQSPQQKRKSGWMNI